MPLKLDVNADSMTNSYVLAHLSKAVYSDDPANEPSFKKTDLADVDTFSNAKTNTFGFVAKNDEHIVVAFRGTQDIRNWITNVQFAMRDEDGGFAHLGFGTALDSVWTPLMQKFKALRDNDQAVWITGHSLGGALATLAAWWFPVMPTLVTTLGQPRVGDAKFAGKYAHNHCRFVNDRDIVPTLPPRVIPVFPEGILSPAFYTHVDTLSHFDENGDLVVGATGELGVTPLLNLAVSSLSTSEAEAKALVMEGVRDHDLGKYIRCIEKNLP